MSDKILIGAFTNYSDDECGCSDMLIGVFDDIQLAQAAANRSAVAVNSVSWLEDRCFNWDGLEMVVWRENHGEVVRDWDDHREYYLRELTVNQDM